MKFTVVSSLVVAAMVFASPLVAQDRDAKKAFSATEASDGSSINFNIGADRFSMPMPSGYCEPTGENALISEQIAAGDSMNFTLADVDRCGTFGEDYVLVKTPRVLPPINISRSVFLDAIVSELQNGTALQEGFEQGSADVSNLSDGALSVDVGTYGYDSYDEECVYLAGILRVSAEDGSVKAQAATCMTLVGNRNIAVHAYDFTNNPATRDELKERARAIAMSIIPR